MNMIINPENLKMLANNFVKQKKKERFDMILEPLQAILQICFLGHYDIGTKVTIENNLLHIQEPSVTQGLVRWMNNDGREDLYYLFNVFRRFPIYYSFLKRVDIDLYNLIIKMAIDGLDKLIDTYKSSDKISILHSLQMFKIILDNPDIIDVNYDFSTPKQSPYMSSLTPPNNGIIETTSSSSNVDNMEPLDLDYNVAKNKKKEKQKNKEMAKKQKENTINKEPSNSVVEKNTVLALSETQTNLMKDNGENFNIDRLFSKITKIYNENHFKIMKHTLIMIMSDSVNKQHYIDGCNMFMKPIQKHIKQWINSNLVF